MRGKPCLAYIGLALVVAGCAGTGEPAGLDAGQTPDPATSALAIELTPEESRRARIARRTVQDARAFLRRDEPEPALRASRRGLMVAPEDPALIRTEAEALERLGLADQAHLARKRADAIDPPPPPLSDGPRPGRYDDLLILLQTNSDVSGRAPSPERSGRSLMLLESLEDRLVKRLRGVLVIDESMAEPSSVPGARAWLLDRARDRIAGLRTLRAFCGWSIKDGAYAVATLAWTTPGEEPVLGVVRYASHHDAQVAGC